MSILLRMAISEDMDFRMRMAISEEVDFRISRGIAQVASHRLLTVEPCVHPQGSQYEKVVYTVTLGFPRIYRFSSFHQLKVHT
jgi:hypothetical protein